MRKCATCEWRVGVMEVGLNGGVCDGGCAWRVGPCEVHPRFASARDSRKIHVHRFEEHGEEVSGGGADS